MTNIIDQINISVTNLLFLGELLWPFWSNKYDFIGEKMSELNGQEKICHRAYIQGEIITISSWECVCVIPPFRYLMWKKDYPILMKLVRIPYDVIGKFRIILWIYQFDIMASKIIWWLWNTPSKGDFVLAYIRQGFLMNVFYCK